ncbi:MAG: MarR family transcriptional regulator [Streptococcaceae bacterium]|nr:MarR family transcriptional regulator [Streptococcaceae bacterium]
MDYQKTKVHLTKIFNNVLVIEEQALKNSKFKDVSIKEMHTLDAIGDNPRDRGATVSEIAGELMLTLSTITISLNRLERKGYVVRHRSASDKRVVYVSLTKKGMLLYRIHRKFYQAMVKRIVAGMDDANAEIMATGLAQLYKFLEDWKNGQE